MKDLLITIEMLDELRELRRLLVSQHDVSMGRFDDLKVGQKELLSKADASYNSLMRIFTDEAKEGPRLFSLRPVDSGFLDKPKWVSQKFHLVLWCEHSRLPLFVLNDDEERGIYELDLPREWVTKAAPFLKALTVTLSLVLPVASSATKLIMDDTIYDKIEDQLKFGKDSLDAVLKGSEKVGEWLGEDDSLELPHGAVTRAEGAILRELHGFLKERDVGFGGLVRVRNKKDEFLWVHEKFKSEY